ncbi:MAG: hypothetical protein WCK10_00915 [Candidatus Staskawiczbacteria bacterium]
MNKKIIILLSTIIVVTILLAIGFFTYQKLNLKQDINPQLNPDQIMQIAKTDKDYAEVSSFLVNFDPEIITYTKLGLTEYNKLKPEWKNQGFEDRINLIDKLTLTNSTYWIELKNKNDETKGLRLVLDTKENKSILLIVSLSVSAGAKL